MAGFNTSAIINSTTQRKDLERGTVYLTGLDTHPDQPTAAGQLKVETINLVFGSTLLYCSAETSPGVIEWVDVSMYAETQNPADDEIWVTG